MTADCPCGRSRIGCEYHDPLRMAIDAVREATERVIGAPACTLTLTVPWPRHYAVGSRLRVHLVDTSRLGVITEVGPSSITVVLDADPIRDVAVNGVVRV